MKMFLRAYAWRGENLRASAWCGENLSRSCKAVCAEMNYCRNLCVSIDVRHHIVLKTLFVCSCSWESLKTFQKSIKMNNKFTSSCLSLWSRRRKQPLFSFALRRHAFLVGSEFYMYGRINWSVNLARPYGSVQKLTRVGGLKRSTQSF